MKELVFCILICMLIFVPIPIMKIAAGFFLGVILLIIYFGSLLGMKFDNKKEED